MTRSKRFLLSVLVTVLGCDRTPAPLPDTAPVGDAIPQVTALGTRVPIPPGADTLVHRVAVRADSIPHDGSPGHARSRIVFADSASLEVPVRHATLLATLPAAQGADWLLVAGTECSECDAPEVVWVFRGVPGSLSSRGVGFAFPGAHTEAGIDETPYFRSRLFLGVCTADTSRTAVWFEETLQPDSARQHLVRILRSAPRLSDTTFAWSDAFETAVLSRVRSGSCREVPSRDQAIL
ncbi:hypothetical protein [Pseudogemmatithrix spongiicola]|uniref:Lipoprotein n=1 Tax=Pseudogemmatithrix spongiicola TaxID=3062599 RepID=A0AA49K2W7_9BACT|nr:hypothetical protein Strain318_002843 [Gemmatimonadaceae bacterium 'strain 318']